MKYSKRSGLQIILIIFLLLLSSQIKAQIVTGQHDPTFDGDGIRTYSPSGLFDLLIQPDKKIVVAGTGVAPPPTSNPTGVVVRFNENGSLDTSFSGDGVFNHTLTEWNAGVALMADGRIQVGGCATFGAVGRFSLGRHNADGSPDTTFDGDGRVDTTVGFYSCIASVRVLPDGKIIAAGTGLISKGMQEDFVIAKYNVDGSLDTSFGSGGRVATDFNNLREVCNRMIIQPDGKIILAGYYRDALSGDRVAMLVRYNADGSVDTTFGTNGRASRAGSAFTEAVDVALQPDGKIIITGRELPITRFNSNGTFDMEIDPTFWLNTWSVAVREDGKIFVRGSRPANAEFIVRYSAAGIPEVSYPLVPMSIDAGTDRTSLPEIELAPDAKIVTGKNGGGITLERLLNVKGIADFDNDLKTDISIFRPSGGEWWINRSSGGTIAYAFGASSDRIVPADYTGDNKTDVAIFRPSTGEWFILRSEDSSYYSFPFGISGDIPAPGDFDGDNKADAAVFRPSDTNWYISLSSGGTTIQQFGLNGDVPVTADYDSDGKSDIAIYRPSLGQWWIQRSTAGTIAYTFGNSSDKPVPGDYTGDGKSDVAIWRSSTGEWFVLRSEDSSYYSYPFGTGGDLPAPGDYDGDGKFDSAIFRPADSTWWVLKVYRRNLDPGFRTSGRCSRPRRIEVVEDLKRNSGNNSLPSSLRLSTAGC